jgi:Xaa-Pro aminopeptidase
MINRIKKLWRLLDAETDGMLITSPENVRYLCGFSGTEGTVLLTRREGFFLTDGRYTTQAGEQVKQLTVITFREKVKETGRLIKKLRVRTLGFEARHLTVAEWQDLEREILPVALKPCTDVLDRLRMVKDAAEIALLRTAARIAAQSLQEVLPLIRPGIREKDVACELEYQMGKNGGEGPAFQLIVASGYRAALPHGVASMKKIAAGDVVVIDYGTLYRGYFSDETCTVFVGKPAARQKKIYAIVLEAHDRAIAALRPGKTLKTIDAAARRYIEQQGFKKYFNHGTGHGVGLAVHEPPRVSYLADGNVAAGMVVTIEPGIYIPGWGGVRIEDTVLVRDRGCEIITRADKRLTVL